MERYFMTLGVTKHSERGWIYYRKDDWFESKTVIELREDFCFCGKQRFPKIDVVEITRDEYFTIHKLLESGDGCPKDMVDSILQLFMMVDVHCDDDLVYHGTLQGFIQANSDDVKYITDLCKPLLFDTKEYVSLSEISGNWYIERCE